MREPLDYALAPVRRVRRFRPVAQDSVASVVLCLLVVALIFEATPPRFLIGPLLRLTAPPSDTYGASAPRVVAGSPELDNAPSVEIAGNGVASTPSPTDSTQADDRRPKKAGKGPKASPADGSGGGATPTKSGPGTTDAAATAPPPAPPPLGLCRGSASANSTKHASSNGLTNGIGHGCV